MTGTVAIVRHEVAVRWLAWPVALVLGGLPLLALAMFGGLDAPAESWLERMTSVSSTGLVGASWVAALGIGVALVGRPLPEGRIAFYLARPIATGAFAAGKLLGGLVVVTGIELALCAPLAIYLRSPSCVAAIVVPGVACLGIGLVVGVVAHARSWWLAVDLVGLAVFTGELRWLAHRLGADPQDAGPPRQIDGRPTLSVHLDRIWLGLGAVGVVALFVAAAAAVMIGRADRRRAHAALSRVLWPTLIVAGAAAVAASS